MRNEVLFNYLLLKLEKGKTIVSHFRLYLMKTKSFVHALIVKFQAHVVFNILNLFNTLLFVHFPKKKKQAKKIEDPLQKSRRKNGKTKF